MDHPDFGGHFIACTNARCQCCVGLRYADKEDPRPLLAEQWNRKPTPSFLVCRNLLLDAAKEALIQAEGCFHNHHPGDDPSQAPEPAHIANLRAAIEAEDSISPDLDETVKGDMCFGDDAEVPSLPASKDFLK